MSKSWCFTINNYTETDVTWVQSLDVSAITVGKEIGDSGTEHLQGFVTWKRKYTLVALKKLHERAHWEIAKAVDAANYCRKGEIIRDEKNSKQGKRTDIETAHQAAKDGISMLDYCSTYSPNWQAIKVFEHGKKTYQKPRDPKDPPKITWIWGKTGVGKTRMVFELEKDLWISAENLKWWDGYENQEATLFDDFRGDFCPFHVLIRILDCYPFNVPVKGGFRVLNSKRMYITSCYPPDKVYQTREDIGQLLRRIHETIELGTENRSSRTEVGKGNTKLSLPKIIITPPQC